MKYLYIIPKNALYSSSFHVQEVPLPFSWQDSGLGNERLWVRTPGYAGNGYDYYDDRAALLDFGMVGVETARMGDGATLLGLGMRPGNFGVAVVDRVGGRKSQNG